MENATDATREAEAIGAPTITNKVINYTLNSGQFASVSVFFHHPPTMGSTRRIHVEVKEGTTSKRIWSSCSSDASTTHLPRRTWGLLNHTSGMGVINASVNVTQQDVACTETPSMTPIDNLKSGESHVGNDEKRHLYTFVGWFVSENGGGTQYVDIVIEIMNGNGGG